MKTPCKSGTVRDLGWITSGSDMVRICDMEDSHLINSIRLYTRRIMAAKMVSGITSVSTLILDYMNQEAKDRGLEVVLRPGDSEENP